VITVHVCQLHDQPYGRWEALLVELAFCVQLFFALSGFLLFRPYFAARMEGRPEPRLRDYAKRRVLRIVPAYWFALTALPLLLGTALVPRVHSGDWWVYYGFGQVYSTHWAGGGIHPAWTLCVEVTFYAFLPAFAWLTRGLGRRVGWRAGALVPLAAMAAVGIAVRALNAATVLPWVLSDTLVGQAQFFALGMSLAVATVPIERPWRPLVRLAARPGVCWTAAAALFLLGAQTLDPFLTPWPALHLVSQRDYGIARWSANDALACAFLTLILVPAMLGSVRVGWPRRVLAWRPLAYLGVISYSAYLWHQPLLGWLLGPALGQQPVRDYRFTSATALFGSARGTLFVFVLTATVLAGTLGYYLVELPFLRLKPGWRRRASARARRLPIAGRRPVPAER
jgi:peptidoglycan/LPS O-acetylase OafA/YrhL